MNFFNKIKNNFSKQRIKKESNVASTPRNKLPMEEFSVIKFDLILWNIVSILLYCSYISFIVLQTNEGKFLSAFITWLLYIYLIVLFLILIISIFQRNKLRSRLKNYKSAMNFFKYFIQLVTLVLSIVTAISTFLTTGKADHQAISTAFFSLGFTIVMVIIEFVKIIIRKNLPTVKRNFLLIRDKREEQLILSGKKKRKNIEENNENNSNKDDEYVEAKYLDDIERKENKPNREKYASSVVFYNEDKDDYDEYDDDDDDFYYDKDYNEDDNDDGYDKKQKSKFKKLLNKFKKHK